MKAVIMAGGEGTRLRPLTSTGPKPMMPLANVPMMEHIVNLLRTHGFDEIVVTVAFMAQAIQNYFGDGSEFGVSIKYATEQNPLGTAGSVGNAKDELTERFLVISGDVLTDIDLGAIWKFHVERNAMATIGLVAVENPLEFGIVITKEDGTIERFLEKPTWGQVFSDTINTGIYVLEPEVFDYIPPDRSVDFSSEVFPALLADGKTLVGCVAEGYWEDVGTLEAYLSAHQDVLDGKVKVDIGGFEVQPGVWLAEGAEIAPDAVVEGPAVIGPGSRIEGNTRLGEYSVVGSNVRVRSGVDLERVVVHDNTYIGDGARLRGSIVGRACDIRNGARCDEGVVLGDECFIGENAYLGGGVKVYPFKTVEAGAVVNDSIVWESRGARSLFGRYGVSGLANVDITAELATKLAMAYGTSLPKGSTVVTSRDSSRAARMLKRAMMAGLNAAGIDVADLEIASIPVTRFQVRSPRAMAGMTVRLSSTDPGTVRVRFFDSNGADISEDVQRKIERLFQREDYRRVFAGEIGDITYPPHALEDYTAALEQIVDLDTLYTKRFKLVVDYGYGSTSFVMPNVLSKLRTDTLAVNPFASTGGLLSFDLRAAVENVSALVKASGAHLGAVLDPHGERITFIDDGGYALTDVEATLAMVELVGDYLLGDKIALPVNTTQQAESIASRYNIGVEYVKMSSRALADAATLPGVGLAANGEGGFILPGFLPAFDAAAALVKMLDLLARNDRPLSAVVANLPRVHIAHETLVTPWEQKGTVMRSFMEHAAGREVVLIDGVKVIHEGGWVLAVPDPEEPVTHIWAESLTSDTEARKLAQEYGRRIRQMLR
ncbi:MAG: sugar phosphate nucleotidyltransferase [Acidimicrobiia bacterium]